MASIRNSPNSKTLLSRSYKRWARNMSEKDRLYEKNPKREIAMGLTDDFREVFRPFFLILFGKVYCERKAFKDLKLSIRVIEGEVGKSTTATIVGTPIKATKELLTSNIHDLKEMICYIKNLEKGKGRRAPPQINHFLGLCKTFLAKESQNVEDLRVQFYFVTKNPLVYTTTESMIFLEKAIFLEATDRNRFRKEVDLEALTCFAERVDKHQMPELYAVLTEYSKDKKMGMAQHSKSGAEALVFADKINQHFHKQFKNPGTKGGTMKYIYKEATESVLYDLIPVTFRGISESYSVLPSTINGTTINEFIFESLSLVDYMEEDPQIIWPLSNRKYGLSVH